MERTKWDVEKMYSMPCSNLELGWSREARKLNHLFLAGMCLFSVRLLLKRGVTSLKPSLIEDPIMRWI